MALLMLAPTVTRVLVVMSWAPALSMPDLSWCGDTASMPASAPDTVPDHHGGTGHPAGTDACGYCLLLAHTPALGSVLAFVVPPAPTARLALDGVDAPTPDASPVDLRSRGPPWS